MSLVVSALMIVFGKLAINILYGEEYMIAYGPLVILIWSTGFAMIGSARGTTWILAEKLNKYSKYYVFISSITNVVLNMLFIPMWGLLGAATATLISQLTTAFIAPLLFKRTREFVLLYFRSWKISVTELRALIEKKRTSNG